MSIHLYDTYNKAKNIFVRPKLKFNICKWTNSPLLPVWRRGFIIKFGTNGQYLIQNGAWFGAWAKHTYWNPNYLASCSKFGRFWRRFVKPTIQLPIWLSFYVFNLDVVWKWKYDDICFEYPPQFVIVLFGISFNWWLKAPERTNISYLSDDSYWESLLNYLFKYEQKIEDVKLNLGNYENKKSSYPILNENFLK